MNRIRLIISSIIGDPEYMETDRYFLIVTCFTASVFLMILCGVHLIMNLGLPPVFFAGGSSIIMLGLYYFVRFKKCLFYPKLFLTLFGLIMLDFTWYTKYLSNGPVLFFILIFGALVIWVWEGKSLAAMLTIYFINLLILFVIDYTAPEHLFAYPGDKKRSVDIFLSFMFYASLMIFLLYIVKREFTRQKEKAIRSDKLKSAFLANMSHEIRTPLNAIVGFSRLLSSGKDSSDTQKYNTIIQKNSDNLLRLINDIIDLSKIEAGDMEMQYSDFDIYEIFIELQEYYSLELEKRGKSDILLDYSIPEDITAIHSDAFRIKQVLSNLLDNAIKSTEKGEIIFDLVKKDDRLLFTVSDTGSGIKAEDQERIFNQFTKLDYLDPESEGTGIGLAIVKHIAELLKGEIWLESTEGEGSSFYFSIPSITPARISKPAPKPLDLSTPADDKSVKQILVVEDEQSNYLLLETMLELLGIEYHHVTNGIDALAYVKKSRNVSLILMDIKLPLMDGYETTREIKKINPGIVIIAQTAFAMLGDKEKALEAGCDDYLPKPLDLNKLQELIKRYFPD